MNTQSQLSPQPPQHLPPLIRKPQPGVDRFTTMLAGQVIELTNRISTKYINRSDICIEARYNWYTSELSTIVIKVTDQRMVLDGVIQLLLSLTVRMRTSGEITLEHTQSPHIFQPRGVPTHAIIATFPYHNPQFPNNMLERIEQLIEEAISSKVSPIVGARRRWH